MRSPLDVVIRQAAGGVVSSGELYVYERGTKTPAVGYTSEAGEVEVSYPLEPDSEGRFPEAWYEPGSYDLYRPGDAINPTQPWEAPGLPSSVVSRGQMESEGSVLDILTLYPEDFAEALGIKPGEDYSAVFQAITEYIREQAAALTFEHFAIRLGPDYLLDGNPVTSLGGNSIWPFPTNTDTACVIELVCAPGGTTLRTTRTGDEYSAEHGPPSIIGGPTNEQMGKFVKFSAARLVISGRLQTKAPNNPSIAGQNWSRMGGLRADSLQDAALEASATEPSHAHAFGIYMPEGDNSGLVTVRELFSTGRLVGVISNAHLDCQLISTIYCKLGWAVTGNEQYAGNDGHSSTIVRALLQRNQYNIGSWSPTKGVISLPAGNPAQMLGTLALDIEHAEAEKWYTTVYDVLDANNELSGGAIYGVVLAKVGRKNEALLVSGGANFILRNVLEYITWVNVEKIDARLATVGTYPNAIQCSISNGMLLLHGARKATEEIASGTTIFTLPPGFRPLTKRLVILPNTLDGYGTLIIEASGAVILHQKLQAEAIVGFDFVIPLKP